MTVALQNNAGFLRRTIVANPGSPFSANVSRLVPRKKRRDLLRSAGEDKERTREEN